MATMITEVYDALRAAGAPDDKARDAAQAMAAYAPRFASLRAKLAEIKAALEARLSKLEWMVGFVVVLCVAILGRLLFIH
jgi:hypothetical protein